MPGAGGAYSGGIAALYPADSGDDDDGWPVGASGRSSSEYPRVVVVALSLFSAAAFAAATVSAARRFLSSASSSCVQMISRIGNILSRS